MLFLVLLLPVLLLFFFLVVHEYNTVFAAMRADKLYLVDKPLE